MNDQTALAALAAFLPRISRKDFRAGVPAGGERMANGVITMPHIAYGEVVREFEKAAHEHGWVYSFDYIEWAQTEEGKRLLEDPSAIEVADFDQLRRLLTWYIRAERFCDGALFKAFEKGQILRIVERASVLLEEGERSE
jgi:hypothetical protein